MRKELIVRRMHTDNTALKSENVKNLDAYFDDPPLIPRSRIALHAIAMPGHTPGIRSM